MRRNRLLHLGCCLLCLLVIQAFVFAQTPETSGTPVNPAEPAPKTEPSPETTPPPEPSKIEPENLIHIGDLIDVDVLGSTEFDWRGTLTPEGFLNGVEFVEEPIFGLCQRPETVARKIAEGYSKLLKDPQVSVRIVDRSGRPISYLYGAVRTPQRFRLNRAVRLSELIILSGGMTEKASGEIQILRPPALSCRAQAERELKTPPDTALIEAKNEASAIFINIKIADLLKGDKSANPFILNGDVVTVREAQPVFVAGGVSNPRQINAFSKLTVTRAILSAGGFLKNADRQKVLIFRRDGAEMKVIEIDLKKIENKEDEDFELRAFDVVEVGIQGKEKRKFPPAVLNGIGGEGKSGELPLRVID